MTGDIPERGAGRSGTSDPNRRWLNMRARASLAQGVSGRMPFVRNISSEGDNFSRNASGLTLNGKGSVPNIGLILIASICRSLSLAVVSANAGGNSGLGGDTGLGVKTNLGWYMFSSIRSLFLMESTNQSGVTILIISLCWIAVSYFSPEVSVVTR